MPVEDAFLADIRDHPDDDTPRLIYADWLEERGDIRAEFLRVQVRLAELKHKAREDRRLKARLRHRLRQLLPEMDRNWLALVDRTDIENCGLPFAFECPKRWELLQQTDNDRVRFCDVCRRNVHHCTSASEARAEAARGHCVAIDPALMQESPSAVPTSPRGHRGRLQVGVLRIRGSEFDTREEESQQRREEAVWRRTRDNRRKNSRPDGED
jgi:uncharacterized protein (TIGR02996 family)